MACKTPFVCTGGVPNLSANRIRFQESLTVLNGTVTDTVGGLIRSPHCNLIIRIHS
jgi:hypothetical protein